MDNLKLVNDTHGHEAGDGALQTAGRALRSVLRRSDEAYRIGGDEFAVVLSGAAVDAERGGGPPRARRSGAGPRDGDPIEASFGVSVYEQGDDPERMLAGAEEGLYQAKRRSRHEALA